MPTAVREILIKGDEAHVVLTQGFVAIIDTADVPKIAGFNWCAARSGAGKVYAMRKVRGSGRSNIYMHREIAGDLPGLDVDHIDGDTLNNRRGNLRHCTRSQNLANRTAERGNQLGMKGVWLDRGRYRACIQHHGVTRHLGRFDTPEAASAAYAAAARELFGDFART